MSDQSQSGSKMPRMRAAQVLSALRMRLSVHSKQAPVFEHFAQSLPHLAQIPLLEKKPLLHVTHPLESQVEQLSGQLTLGVVTGVVTVTSQVRLLVSVNPELQALH